MTDKKKSLAVHLAEAQEVERRRLARLLHDEIGQNLTALGFNLEFIQSQLPPSLPAGELLRERVKQALRLVEDTTDQIRQIIDDLRPPMLDEYGLVESLDWYAQYLTTQTDLTIIFEGDALPERLAPSIENELFRITQAALTNILDHAQATQATISLKTLPTMTRLMITDNGVGFASKQIPPAKSGLGLSLMKERAEAIQARYFIKSEINQGTQVTIELPR